MADHTTARFGLTGLDPSPGALEYLQNWPATFNAFLDALDGKLTGYSVDVIARRPTVGTAGRFFLATDDRTSSPNGTLYFDNGTAWVIAPTNSYSSGTLLAIPRTGVRGQFYYATDDRTAGTNGTLYLFDGTGWVQVNGVAAAFTTFKDLPFAREMVVTSAGGTGPLLMGRGNNAGNALPCDLATTALEFDPADWAAGGRSTMMRLRGSCVVNAVAPAATLTISLFPVTTTGGASGVAPTITAVGGAVGGVGGSVVIVSPAASSTTRFQIEFAAPAAGIYALGAICSRAVATGSSCALLGRLQVRQA